MQIKQLASELRNHPVETLEMAVRKTGVCLGFATGISAVLRGAEHKTAEFSKDKFKRSVELEVEIGFAAISAIFAYATFEFAKETIQLLGTDQTMAPAALVCTVYCAGVSRFFAELPLATLGRYTFGASDAIKKSLETTSNPLILELKKCRIA